MLDMGMLPSQAQIEGKAEGLHRPQCSILISYHTTYNMSNFNIEGQSHVADAGLPRVSTAPSAVRFSTFAYAILIQIQINFLLFAQCETMSQFFGIAHLQENELSDICLLL